MGLTLQVLTKCCNSDDFENVDNDDIEKPQQIKSNPILTTDKNAKLINLETADSFSTSFATLPCGPARN